MYSNNKYIISVTDSVPKNKGHFTILKLPVVLAYKFKNTHVQFNLILIKNQIFKCSHWLIGF